MSRQEKNRRLARRLGIYAYGVMAALFVVFVLVRSYLPAVLVSGFLPLLYSGLLILGVVVHLRVGTSAHPGFPWVGTIARRPPTWRRWSFCRFASHARVGNPRHLPSKGLFGSSGGVLGDTRKTRKTRNFKPYFDDRSIGSSIPWKHSSGRRNGLFRTTRPLSGLGDVYPT